MEKIMKPLTSQRYTPLNHHPRPKFNDNRVLVSSSLVLHHDTVPTRPAPAPTPPSTVQLQVPIPIPNQPFRLLHLPLELQHLVYHHYFGTWEVTLDYERLSMLRSKFLIQGIPPIDLLLVSRRVHREAAPVRLAGFNGRLNLNNVFILVPLRRQQRFDWLRRHVRTLHFSDSSVHPERWNRYYDNFPRLERLEIEFPSVVRLGGDDDGGCGRGAVGGGGGGGGLDLDEVLKGKHDTLLLESLDSFRLALVDQLKEMVVVVVSQKYCLSTAVAPHGWSGILEVKIQLASTGAQIVGRNYDENVNVISKRQFRRPAEL